MGELALNRAKLALIDDEPAQQGDSYQTGARLGSKVGRFRHSSIAPFSVRNV